MSGDIRPRPDEPAQFGVKLTAEARQRLLDALANDDYLLREDLDDGISWERVEEALTEIMFANFRPRFITGAIRGGAVPIPRYPGDEEGYLTTHHPSGDNKVLPSGPNSPVITGEVEPWQRHP